MQSIRWHDVSDIPAAALAIVLSAARRALAARGRFDLVLAGGSTPRALYQALLAAQPDLRAWQIWLGDERCLPAIHPERNSQMIENVWLTAVAAPLACAGQPEMKPAMRLGASNLPVANWHPIPAELGAVAGAAAYAEQLAGVGTFDLVLLGLGEDGHTASLFPDHPWEADGLPTLAVHDAPKPPAERVSLTASRLSDAREVVFLVNGAGKQTAIARWQAGEPLPAAAIQPPGGVDVLLAGL